jgi:hypothetical protein
MTPRGSQVNGEKQGAKRKHKGRTKPTKGNSGKRNRDKDNTGDPETSDAEYNLEEREVRNPKHLFRNKDCIVIFSNHVIMNRTGTRYLDLHCIYNSWVV